MITDPVYEVSQPRSENLLTGSGQIHGGNDPDDKRGIDSSGIERSLSASWGTTGAGGV